MKLEIERLAVTLQGVPEGFGDQLGGHLRTALGPRLSSLDLRGAAASLAQLDLGAIDVPAHAEPQLVARLVAERVAVWLADRHGDTVERDATGGEGR